MSEQIALFGLALNSLAAIAMAYHSKRTRGATGPADVEQLERRSMTLWYAGRWRFLLLTIGFLLQVMVGIWRVMGPTILV